MAKHDISDVIRPGMLKSLKKGQVLTFMQEGHKRDYKIVKLTDKRVIVEPVTLYDPEQVKIVDDPMQAS